MTQDVLFYYPGKVSPLKPNLNVLIDDRTFTRSTTDTQSFCLTLLYIHYRLDVLIRALFQIQRAFQLHCDLLLCAAPLAENREQQGL